MNQEDNKEMKEIFRNIIERNLDKVVFQWLQEKAALSKAPGNNYELNLAFTSMPRKTGKKQIHISDSVNNEISELLAGFSVQLWTIDRLCRVWLLLQLDISDKENYIKRIENLFPQAEMNEQVALYSALPLLAFPEEWKLQCAVGVRSNIGDVLNAIMYYNPYPAAWMEEPAWNQLVMKAFFTGMDINKITGIDKRANQNLANTLFDYVEERWSAHRSEDPQIWRLTGKYLDETHVYMMERLFKDGNEKERQAAALACSDSTLDKAAALLEVYPEYKSAIQQRTLTWSVVAEKE